MNLVQLAGILPRDPQFREWVGGFVNGDPVSVDEAARFVRIVCKVESRRELATNTHAADRFHHYIRRLFLDWRDQQLIRMAHAAPERAGTLRGELQPECARQ
ncbi:hypothetical protein [Burkholderia stabilis]|uniref:Uncharacterized protein n=1 Tax=Burkholderia stabilis TaxID=95485 RepID=A0AAJ5N8J9_9BURK|nr:hypothetical protein [Burkholderia stabilis]VBB10642.1 hypothetical protein BSTAB16_0749 [Burkholderia stabilis]VBB13397.1 hypothetical protein BSTAB16_3582 [Burkholderia stabilis]